MDILTKKNHTGQKKGKGSTVGKNRKYNPNLWNISILDIRFANIENRRINSERERIEGRTTGKRRGKNLHIYINLHTKTCSICMLKTEIVIVFTFFSLK